MLPPTVPLFPLPNVVLFPGVYLPLHIFEPRYRALTREALDGDRIIGMVLIKPGFDEQYEGRPPIFPIGCAGVVTHAEPLDDGRYNIVLQGVERFRVLEEDHSHPFRVATVQGLGGAEAPLSDLVGVRTLRDRLERVLVPLVERAGAELNIPPSMSDADLIHALGQYLELEPLEKQALLECESLVTRGTALADLLEMKAMSGGLSAPTSRH